MNNQNNPNNQNYPGNQNYPSNQNGYSQPVSPRTKGVTAVLCFFLGALGIHRFYTGNIGTAVAMLVIWLISFIITICTLGLCSFLLLITGIWALVDFIMILCGSFKDGNGAYIK